MTYSEINEALAGKQIVEVIEAETGGFRIFTAHTGGGLETEPAPVLYVANVTEEDITVE